MRWIFYLLYSSFLLIPRHAIGQSAPLIIGTADTLYSKILSEKRVLNISLPENYHPNDSIHYPVIFLLDGGIQEDFIHILGLYRFNSTSWNQVTPPAIIVGITNTNRMRDMTFPTSDTAFSRKYPQSGHADEFIRFIRQELIPYIDHHYKANQDRTIIGESLAGLLATQILLQHPQIFQHYIIVSPSLWWDNRSIFAESIDNLKNAASGGRIHVFLAVGKEGRTPGNRPGLMQKDVKRLYQKLETIPELQIDFDYLKDKQHANVLHQAVYNALLKAEKMP